MEQQAVARVESPQDRRHTVEVASDKQVDPSIAVEVIGHNSIDRGKLRLEWKRAKIEGAVSPVDGNRVLEPVRHKHRRLPQLGGRKNVLDPTGAEVAVGRIAAAQLRHQTQELIASSQRVAHPALVEREDLLR